MGQRFALASLILAAFALMLFHSANAVFVEHLRTAVTDVTAPILEVVVQPVRAVNRTIANVREVANLRTENAELKEEVARLRAWHAAAYRLAAQNKAFRKLLNYRGPGRRAYVTARVIADGRGPFVRSVLVDAGARDGVRKGQAAETEMGLVGRVSDVGRRSARVLILTDLNSRIPVVIEDTQARAILAGNNSALPELAFLPENTRVKVGQRVVTSGHGGVLPPGIAVGVVESVDGGDVKVRPFVDLDRLSYLQVIDFKAVPGLSRPSIRKERRKTR